MPAIAILGREVMAPRGLLGLGCDTLDASGPEIAAGLGAFLNDNDSDGGEEGGTAAVVATANGGGGDDDEGGAKKSKHDGPASSSPLPLLIHCTQGKDRTGLMVALVLLICKVPLDAVEFDYELTDEKLVEERGERLAEIREMGLPDEFGVTVKGFVPGIVAHLDDKYGGLDAYLDGIGFGPDKRTRLRERLLY